MGRIPRPCRFPGCRGMAYGGAWCAAHRPAPVPDRARPGSAARGYGARWQRLRVMVLRRQPICCWPDCGEPATEVDHVVALANGGDESPDNLQGLCKRHHSMKTFVCNGGLGHARRTTSG